MKYHFTSRLSQHLNHLVILLLMLSYTANIGAQSASSASPNDFAWSPDSMRLAVGGTLIDVDGTLTGGFLIVIDPATGAQIWNTRNIYTGYSNLQWNADGTQIAASRCNVLDIFATATGNLVSSHGIHVGGCQDRFQTPQKDRNKNPQHRHSKVG